MRQTTSPRVPERRLEIEGGGGNKSGVEFFCFHPENCWLIQARDTYIQKKPGTSALSPIHVTSGRRAEPDSIRFPLHYAQWEVTGLSQKKDAWTSWPEEDSESWMLICVVRVSPARGIPPSPFPCAQCIVMAARGGERDGVSVRRHSGKAFSMLLCW